MSSSEFELFLIPYNPPGHIEYEHPVASHQQVTTELEKNWNAFRSAVRNMACAPANMLDSFLMLAKNLLKNLENLTDDLTLVCETRFPECPSGKISINQQHDNLLIIVGTEQTFENKIQFTEDLHEFVQENHSPISKATHMFELAFAKKSTEDFKKGLKLVQEHIFSDPRVTKGNIDINTNENGDLVLEIQKIYIKSLGELASKSIEILNLIPDFYRQIESPDADIIEKMEFAYTCQNSIHENSPAILDQWRVKNYFELMMEHRHNQFEARQPDFFLDFMGSGESKKKFAGRVGITESNPEGSPSLFKSKENSVVIDGPSSLRGKGVDLNVLDGFYALIENINNGKHYLQISGLSRGAVEAIAANNLLMEFYDAAKNNNMTATEFTNQHLKSVKPHFTDYFNDPDKIQSLDNALNILRNNERPKIGLMLADPVIGPQIPGFMHNAFGLAASLQLRNEVHQDVDIIASSQQQKRFFELHLPKIIGGNHVPKNIYKVHSSHGSVTKEIHEVKSEKKSKSTGSYEGHSAACLLSGRSEEIQSLENLSTARKVTPRLVPAYKNRVQVFSTGLRNSPQPEWSEEVLLENNPSQTLALKEANLMG